MGGGVAIPLYEYQCQTCPNKFEANARVEMADNPVFCPSCGCLARRLYSHFNIKVHPSYNEAQEIVHERYRKGEIA